MTRPDPNLDQVSPHDELHEPDFAAEHDEPTFAEELADRPGMESDEATPSADSGGAAWRDPER